MPALTELGDVEGDDSYLLVEAVRFCRQMQGEDKKGRDYLEESLSFKFKDILLSPPLNLSLWPEFVLLAYLRSLDCGEEPINRGARPRPCSD